MRHWAMTLVLIMFISSVCYAGQPERKPAVTEGWIKVAESSFTAWKLTTEACREIDRGWSVDTAGDRITVKSKSYVEMDRWSRLPRLPDQLQKAIPGLLGSGRPKLEVKEAYRGLPFENGWISGYDLGEFGGGVFWLSVNGKSFRWLYSRNPIDLVTDHDAMLILMGSRHMFHSGSGVILNPVNFGANAPVPEPVDLGETPVAAAPYRGDNDSAGFLILTDDGFREISAFWRNPTVSVKYPIAFSSFHITSLQPYLGSLDANSFALSKDHSTSLSDLNESERIYIGLRDHLVVMRHVPRDGFYFQVPPEEIWYVHSSCVRREKCKCVPASGEELKKIVQLP